MSSLPVVRQAAAPEAAAAAATGCTPLPAPPCPALSAGFGDTDEGSGTDPFETGAHDLAMEDAGIHEFNLMQ